MTVCVQHSSVLYDFQIIKQNHTSISYSGQNFVNTMLSQLSVQPLFVRYLQIIFVES